MDNNSRARRGAAGGACKKDAGRSAFFMRLIGNATFKETRDGFYERMAERGYGPGRPAIVFARLRPIRAVPQSASGKRYVFAHRRPGRAAAPSGYAG